MKFIERLAGCHDGAISYRRGTFYFSKPWDMIRYRFWCRIDWLEDLPRRWGWVAANHLSKLVCRLRGHRSYPLSYDLYGNRAEVLRGYLVDQLVLTAVSRISEEELNEAMGHLDELSMLAKANCWHDGKRLKREAL